MSIDLSGKTALVTGGGVGIGRAGALALARAGARVAVTFLSHEPDDDFLAGMEQAGSALVAERMDATNEEDVSRVVERVADGFGSIDILVNNVGGLLERVDIADMDSKLWHQILDVNLSSAFFCTRAVLPFMNSGWGRIINISSLAGHNGGSAGSTAYATAKAGMFGLTRGLAKELAPNGITVNAVAPGLILETPFHETFTPPAAQQEAITRIALARPGLPPDVAGPVVWLASDLAGFVTGTIVDINGGQYFR
jgi:3-oxoacyl-[acyl-carrier protein] reductase